MAIVAVAMIAGIVGYTPYVRYWLPAYPLLVASCVLAAGSLFRSIRWRPQGRWPPMIAGTVLALLLFLPAPLVYVNMPWDVYAKRISTDDYLEEKFEGYRLVQQLNGVLAPKDGVLCTGYYGVYLAGGRPYEFTYQWNGVYRIHDVRSFEEFCRRYGIRYWIVSHPRTMPPAISEKYWTPERMVSASGAVAIFDLAASPPDRWKVAAERAWKTVLQSPVAKWSPSHHFQQWVNMSKEAATPVKQAILLKGETRLGHRIESGSPGDLCRVNLAFSSKGPTDPLFDILWYDANDNLVGRTNGAAHGKSAYRAWLYAAVPPKAKKRLGRGTGMEGAADPTETGVGDRLDAAHHGRRGGGKTEAGIFPQVAMDSNAALPMRTTGRARLRWILLGFAAGWFCIHATLYALLLRHLDPLLGSHLKMALTQFFGWQMGGFFLSAIVVSTLRPSATGRILGGYLLVSALVLLGLHHDAGAVAKLAILLLWMACATTGMREAVRRAAGERYATWGIAAAAVYAALVPIGFVLGILHLITPSIVTAVAVATALPGGVVCVWRTARWNATSVARGDSCRQSVVKWCLLEVIWVVLAIEFIGASTPEVFSDAARVHVPYMQQVVADHGISHQYACWFRLEPMAAQTYGAAMAAVGTLAAAKWFSWLALAVLVMLVAEEVQRRSGSRELGLFAGAAVLSCPILTRLSSSLYVDHVMAMFCTAGFVVLFRACAPPVSAESCSRRRSWPRWCK